MIKNNSTSAFFKKGGIFNIIIALLLCYFVFHSIYGNRGIIAYFKLQADLQKDQVNLESLRMRRLTVENRTKMLRPDSLDIDMLDEKIRNVLGYSKSKEKIFTPKTNKEK